MTSKVGSQLLPPQEVGHLDWSIVGRRSKDYDAHRKNGHCDPQRSLFGLRCTPVIPQENKHSSACELIVGYHKCIHNQVQRSPDPPLGQSHITRRRSAPIISSQNPDVWNSAARQEGHLDEQLSFPGTRP